MSEKPVTGMYQDERGNKWWCVVSPYDVHCTGKGPNNLYHFTCAFHETFRKWKWNKADK